MLNRRKNALKILAWPRASPSNVYTGSLNDALSSIDGILIEGLSFSGRRFARLVLSPPDIIHIHWFERAFWSPNWIVALKQAIFVATLVTALKIRGARLVWTAHDPQPHESPLNRWLTDRRTAKAWRFYEKLLFSFIDGVMLLSSSHRDIVVKRATRLANVPMAVVRHPHYRGMYPDVVTRDEARKKLGISKDVVVITFVGSLRAYKNPDGLMAAFTKYNGQAILLVAGEAESSERTEELQVLAAKDSRIILNIGFVPDDELAVWLRAADLSVLPYRRVTNSGSAHLALSFDVPVLVPNEPVFEELEQLVGTDWVRRFNGDLSAEKVSTGIDWASMPRPAKPDLSALDWKTIAAETSEFYRSVANR